MATQKYLNTCLKTGDCKQDNILMVFVLVEGYAHGMATIDHGATIDNVVTQTVS